jgi:hypothetical protein
MKSYAYNFGVPDTKKSFPDYFKDDLMKIPEQDSLVSWIHVNYSQGKSGKEFCHLFCGIFK